MKRKFTSVAVACFFLFLFVSNSAYPLCYNLLHDEIENVAGGDNEKQNNDQKQKNLNGSFSSDEYCLPELCPVLLTLSIKNILFLNVVCVTGNFHSVITPPPEK